MYEEHQVNVSDLALCQRCPILFAYKRHRHEKDAWKQGIKGKGFYGSMFHRNISRVFFEAALHSKHRLHASLARSIAGGFASLEGFVRENMFMPFVEKHSRSYPSELIMAAAEGVTVWVKAMHDYFREIPSLMRNPERTMSTVFFAPEQKLQADCNLPNGEGRLIVTGRYDALMFNPDKAEARLFEFKGYSKTDAVVPLSQSVIYAWLIERFSGIVPSVEIIYLDEENRRPDIFSSDSVRGMIASSLPGLFYAAFNVITLRRMPIVMKDKDFCDDCRFKNNCASDWVWGFKKRKGASMVSVIVFMMASLMITAHIFFFSTMSAETNALQVKAMQNRFRFDHALDTAMEAIREHKFDSNDNGDPAPAAAFADYEVTHRKITITRANGSPDKYPNYKGFHDKAVTIKKEYDLLDGIHVCIYDLHYAYIAQAGRPITPFYWKKADKSKKVFSPMYKEDDIDNTRYYLIRISRTPSDKLQKKLMHQVLVKRKGSSKPYTVKPLSFQEVWYE